MHNPLLQTNQLPAFKDIRPEHAEPALDILLAENRSRIALLLENAKPYTWASFIDPLEQLDDQLSQMWSTVSHLHAVMNTSAWRDVYHACLPKLSDYSTEMGHHTGLYKAYQAIAQSEDYHLLSPAQKKSIENALRDFHLSGVDLDAEKKKRYGEIQKELTSLSTHFENNVMDATQAWTKLITDPEQLAGLPEHTLVSARTAAEEQKKIGWLLTLDYPCYDAVLTYAESRALREEMYTAYTTRASDQGPQADRFDNTKLMTNIVALRQELAELLHFKNYAELSLETKMAKHTQQVTEFLMDLAQRSRAHSVAEWKELQSFAQMPDLKAWDIGYYSEKLIQQRYNIEEEKIRPYFPMEQVLGGLFEVVERLYDIHIQQRTDVQTWHSDVRFFEIHDAKKNLRGQFYLDPYARQNKRDGAWMDDCRQRWRLPDGTIQIPVAYLVCNFRPPSGNTPALLSHDEVTTLFHEFGHGLQHLLTTIDYPSVAGINGVAWDAVELPSQFMENWCWQEAVLQFLSRHYITGDCLPHEWLQNMLAAKNFHAGLRINRQLLFALFDIQLHSEAHPVATQALLDKLRGMLSVIPTPASNRFQHSFTHIFSGGYAAGYYSYLWAEVLSSDAFSAFEEHGIFDKKTGRAFMQTILEQGGSREPLDLFVEFRGREPNIQALLRHSGLLATDNN